ncbi:2-oxo-4-hydroxy-4-carboxy-5-ureidoimidazoline decarboxylase [Cohnella endophytica]|uniref:2-oxo-4-hydroxy-4-carboxy-5-ureidoimidazoline decarboxylase n=1 Tax=Cohnella endophytica TaxID=2419778 RepID=A0A494XXW5_9BACL|nr:2-oxo-4-hydroxy-4-carboxy-5-ureidoimidazoline decarboxylase [Cohnella endophytica]RKP55425.1 2-oxo-4-hydroxy-4-carboxy-5-ureidoimidazoline decarboxylase [Cohnella endophytica]
MRTKPGIPMLVISKMSKDQFIEVLGGIFENAPWVAEGAWEHRPFKTRKQLHDRMIGIVKEAPEETILALFRGHPDLATRLEVTEYSAAEQQGAGLSQLTHEEYEEFAAYNREYTEKFGFPFIMAVKGKSKNEILLAMKIRIHHIVAEERDTALGEIAKITGFRLEDLLEV